MNLDKESMPKKYSNLFQASIFFFYTMIFLKYLVGEQKPGLQLIFTTSYILIGVSITFFFYFKLEKKSLILILITTLVLISLFVSIFSKNYRYEDNILVVTYFGISLIPIYVKLNYRLFQTFAYTIIGFFGFCIVTGIESHEVFDVSRNFISILLLIGTGYHIISSYQNEKKPSILIIILSLIISIWATGRAGIIAFSILFVLFPFILGVKKKYKILLVLFIAFLSYYAFVNFNSLLFEYGLGRFEEMDIESDRSTMNSEYFNETVYSFENLTIGSPLKSIPSIVEVDNNPHNSFIRLHVYYGIFGFVVILISILFTLIFYFKSKNYLYFVFIIILLLRSSVDSIAFHGPMDPLIYFFIFYYTKNIFIVK